MPATGTGGDVTAGGTTIGVGQWSMQLSNEVQDVTTTSAAGWVQRVSGYNSASLSFQVPLAKIVASNIPTTINAFAPGTGLASCVLPVGNSTHSYTGNFIVSDATVTNPAKTTPTLEVSAVNDGTILFT